MSKNIFWFEWRKVKFLVSHFVVAEIGVVVFDILELAFKNSEFFCLKSLKAYPKWIIVIWGRSFVLQLLVVFYPCKYASEFYCTENGALSNFPLIKVRSTGHKICPGRDQFGFYMKGIGILGLQIVCRHAQPYQQSNCAEMCLFDSHNSGLYLQM